MTTAEVKEVLVEATTTNYFRKESAPYFGTESQAVAAGFRRVVWAELRRRDDYKKLDHAGRAERLGVSPHVVQNIFSDRTVGQGALQTIADELGLDWTGHRKHFKATGKRDLLVAAYTKSLRSLWRSRTATDFPPHTDGLFRSMRECIELCARHDILKRFRENQDFNAIMEDVCREAPVPPEDARAAVCWNTGRLLTEGCGRLLEKAAARLEKADGPSGRTDRDKLVSGFRFYEGLVARVRDVRTFREQQRDDISDAAVLFETAERLSDAFRVKYRADLLRDLLAGASATVEKVVEGRRPPGWFVCHDAELGPLANRALGLLAQGG